MLAGIKFNKALKVMIRVGGFGYTCILGLVLISNFSLFNPNWPFGLFASFSPFLIVMFPFVMVAANLRHNENALERLAISEAKDADVLIITEFPYGGTSEQLLALFPMDGDAQVGLVTDTNLQLGSRIAVISRKPLDGIKLQIESFSTPKIRPRGILRFDYVTAKGNAVSFAVVHPPPPKGPKETEARDTYLKAASQTLDRKKNFVMIGDFNLTPPYYRPCTYR